MSLADTLSVQLYSLRSIPDLAEQFRLLADLGYRHVEPYGALFAEADRLEGLLAEYGLAAPSAHIALDQLRRDPAGTAVTARRLGIRLVVVPYLQEADRPADAAGWDALGATVQTIAEVLAQHGLEMAWHNHDFEFAALPDGSFPLERLLNAAPLLGWEVDLGWVVRAGQEPLVWLKRWGMRIFACHLKDIGTAGVEDGWADVGHGSLDWASLMPACRATAARLFVVEHDNPDDVARFARRARATVAGWEGVPAE